MAHKQHPIGSGFTAAATAADVLAGLDLTNRHAIVTGGHADIGLEVTRALSKAGASITVGARDTERGRAVPQLSRQCRIRFKLIPSPCRGRSQDPSWVNSHQPRMSASLLLPLRSEHSAYGREPERLCRRRSPTVVARMVAAGIGVSLLPRLLARPGIDAGTIQPLDTDLALQPSRVFAIYRFAETGSFVEDVIGLGCPIMTDTRLLRA